MVQVWPMPFIPSPVRIKALPPILVIVLGVVYVTAASRGFAHTEVEEGNITETQVSLYINNYS